MKLLVILTIGFIGIYTNYLYAMPVWLFYVNFT
jgi:hypothetical protein